MKSVPVVFCHGLESGPIGRKSLALKDAGFHLIAPDFRGLHLEARLEVFEPVLAELEDPVVVGSSYGGAVALIGVHRALARGQQIRGLLLLAPALHRSESLLGDDVLAPPEVPTIVIHGANDDIVPIDVSRQLASRGGVELIETDDGHRLAASIDLIVEAVSTLVSGSEGGATRGR